MKAIRCIWLFMTVGALCLASSGFIYAQQNLEMELLSTDDGLSQGMIYDILQDHEGFLWIATKDGLNRYDGYDFKVFTNDPKNPWSISGNTIVKLFEDSAGRIWAASDNSGINIYDKKTGRFHHIRHNPNDPTSLSGNHVSSIVEDSSGYFITAIGEKEINMFRLEDDFFSAAQAPQIIRIQMPPQKRLKRYDLKEKSELDFIELQGITKDTKGRIWVSGDNTIYQLDLLGKKLKIALEGYSFRNAFARADGSIWASSYSHTVFNWDGKNAPIPIGNYLDVRNIWEDEQEHLWVSSIDSLYGIDISGWTPETSSDWGSSHCFYKWKPEDIVFPFNSLIVDQSGILWVGTYGYGLYKNNPKNKAFPHFLPGVSIRSMVLSPDHELYLQNYSFEWFTKDGAYKELNRLKIKDPNTDVFLVSSSKEIWTRLEYVKDNYFQVKRFNPNTNESRRYNISWHHSSFQPMISTQDGSVWMAGFDDIITHINPVSDTIRSYDLKNGQPVNLNNLDKKAISQNLSTALYEDQNGIIWVGTERGFTKVIRPTEPDMPLQITRYQNIADVTSSLSYNHVSCFLDDLDQPDRFLWICTKGGGLNRMDKKTGTFIHFTKKDGLPDDVIYGILPDDEGNLWGSTNKGLFCMSPNKDITTTDHTKFVFRNFSKADGLQENEFNTGAYAKMPDGRLAFGGINGYNIFDPKEVLVEDYQPPVFITKILVNNQTITPYDETGILKSTIETTQKITLSYLDKILTLEFASLDFTAPDRNMYRYQLVGADDTWVEAGNHRSATFLNLSPKEYIFRLQGSNSSGVWSDQITELEIIILPPWWKTWWAYLIYAAVFAAGILVYFQFSINRAKLRQQLVFEKKEAERVRELDALKTQLYMNMTHEFRTPLTIILGMAKQVKENPKEYFNSGLTMITRNGEQLLKLVNSMLDLSKLENGKMSLQLVQGDMVVFLRNIVESFRSYAANKEIQVHFLPEADSVMMDFDKDKLQQVVSNLISNAFKFTPLGGHIYFGLRKTDASVTIRVKDTGRGIPEADLENVFDRFYQVDNSATRQYDGSGIGLALSKELVLLMKGKISVQSPPVGARTGAEFIVELPISQEAVLTAVPLTPLPAVKKDIREVKEKSIGRKPVESGIENPEASRNVDMEKAKTKEKPLILLVEDNPDVVAYVASCLQDYQLAVAENGQEGYDIATEIIPDLIISDVMMPVMDGFEFCRKVKADERTDHIPVIMLTARADMDSKLEGMELGANAYLPKPYEKQELLLTIRNLFELRARIRRHHQGIAGIGEAPGSEQPELTGQEVEDPFVARVRKMIEEHLTDFNLNVDQLAKELHLSPSQFRRKLEALTGFSPNRFIRYLRLNKAKTLLMDEELSITVVAFDSGFSDPSYFTRVFKQELGKTPVDWRMEQLESTQ